jgi:hypothetical protein
LSGVSLTNYKTRREAQEDSDTQEQTETDCAIPPRKSTIDFNRYN